MYRSVLALLFASLLLSGCAAERQHIPREKDTQGTDMAGQSSDMSGEEGMYMDTTENVIYLAGGPAFVRGADGGVDASYGLGRHQLDPGEEFRVAASRQRLKRLSRSRIRPFVVGRVLQYGKYLLRGLRPVSRLHEGPYEPQVIRVIQEPVVRRRLPSVSPHPSEEVEHDAVLSSMSPIIGPCRHRVPPTRRFGATMACESSGRRKGRLRTWNRGP